MIISTKFGLFDVVTINDVDIEATVVGIYIESIDQIIYELEYWHEGTIRVVKQFEWQLSDRTKK